MIFYLSNILRIKRRIYIFEKLIHPKKFLPTLTYEGGKKIIQFITNHLKYPLEAIENKIEGTVIVKYEINYKGHITQTKVISELVMVVMKK
ncbi:MAG: energy transducer TonB [Saprospiraceae bacterium]|nr:energy transducer TonB [Candidatus Defluviibacterium haderslevense]